MVSLGTTIQGYFGTYEWHYTHGIRYVHTVKKLHSY
jgi:hypothetical protein